MDSLAINAQASYEHISCITLDTQVQNKYQGKNEHYILPINTKKIVGKPKIAKPRIFTFEQSFQIIRLLIVVSICQYRYRPALQTLLTSC